MCHVRRSGRWPECTAEEVTAKITGRDPGSLEGGDPLRCIVLSQWEAVERCCRLLEQSSPPLDVGEA